MRLEPTHEQAARLREVDPSIDVAELVVVDEGDVRSFGRALGLHRQARGFQRGVEVRTAFAGLRHQVDVGVLQLGEE